MEQQIPNSPLMRAPLKLRGVFGLSWQLYKRGFWPMFGFTLLLVGVFILILMLAMGNMLSQTGTLNAIEKDIVPGMGNGTVPNDVAATTSALTFMAVVWLVSLIYAFLGMPAYMGATFMEMDQRMEGRVGTFGQLFRYALPIGLKRFYTTFLSELVVRIIAGIVMSILLNVIMPIIMLSFIAAGMKSSNDANIILAVVITMLCSMLLSIVYMVFMSLIYPVAAHEGKRAFDAVGRALKLSLKRFVRLFGALILYVLILLAALAILMLPLALLWQNTTATIIVLSLGLCLWAALIAPYYPAFCTALYVDAAARVPDLPPQNPVIPPASPMQPQA